MEDIARNPTSFGRLVMGSFILGRRMAEMTPGEKNVAVLLPNSIGCLLTVFGLHATGRVPAMLNFSTGAVNMAGACTASQATTIITSRRFIEASGMEQDLALLAEGRKVIFLEELRAELTARDKLYGLFARIFSRTALRMGGASNDPNAPAIVLFTSGSEGLPKGVVLSHRNLQANRYQAAARIAFTASDIVFNALPMFHAFVDGRCTAPRAGGCAHLPLPLAAPLQGGAGAVLRNQCDRAVRHRHLPDGLCPECPPL
ncbi:MAG: AMP-binding protein [Hyphomicrobiales bacterium]